MSQTRSLPTITHGKVDVSAFSDPTVAASHREAIKAEFEWSWEAYKAHAWGHDELLPLSKQHRDWVPGGMGLTILDTLDSLWLLGLHAEYARAIAWVNRSLDFDLDAEVSTFETTIRALGGLLSAHALSHEPILLDKANDLGTRLLKAFDSQSGLPTTKVNLQSGAITHVTAQMEPLVLAEVGSLHLEFAQLSAATGNPTFRNAVDAVASKLAKRSAAGLPTKPLGPILLQHDGSPLVGAMSSMGAGGDSYYEYLLKAWLQTGRAEPRQRKRYAAAAQAVVRHMVKRTPRGSLALVELSTPFRTARPKMDHLACFAPGMLALGAHTGAVRGSAARHMAVAEELLETCCTLYHQTPTGLAPEITEFDLHIEDEEAGAMWPWQPAHTAGWGTEWEDDEAKPEKQGAKGREFRSSRRDAHSLLRPETVESLFIMWRLTHDTKWRSHGWAIFEALRKHARLPGGGYASLESVYELPARHRDHMESFWLAETLKYLFLLFSDDGVLPLDEWVFNTEAHPLPVQRATVL